MPRKPREKSGTGIYHVMLRGVNKQDVFFTPEDYDTFMHILQDAPLKRNATGRILSDRQCQIYAYVLMPNHVHLLIREMEQSISEVMKCIQDRFVFFYNTKYERTGHLFQARFRSEPVNDIAYFKTLLRYIHRNPVKGMLCQFPEDYPYSSWREYLKDQVAAYPICKTDVVWKSFEYGDLVDWVSTDTDDACMDMDNERFVITDAHAWDILSEISHMETVEDFKQTAIPFQLACLKQAIGHGISIRKASRLSICSYQMIRQHLLQTEDFSCSRPHGRASSRALDSASSAVVTSSHYSEDLAYPSVCKTTKEQGLSDRQKAVIEIIHHDNSIGISTIAEMMSVSCDTIYREIRAINTHGTKLFFDKKTGRWYMPVAE